MRPAGPYAENLPELDDPERPHPHAPKDRSMALNRRSHQRDVHSPGARVFDLRAEGHNIIERKVAGKSYSEYKLIRPELQKICRLPDGSHLAGACTCSVKPTEPIKLPPAFEPKPEQQRAISLF